MPLGSFIHIVTPWSGRPECGLSLLLLQHSSAGVLQLPSTYARMSEGPLSALPAHPADLPPYHLSRRAGEIRSLEYRHHIIMPLK